MEKKKQFSVVHQKFEDEFEYRDIKPGDQGGDNDTDKVETNNETNDDAKKETDKAYAENSAGSFYKNE
jgi:hypothetical protein